jgi:hypothetical protein
MDRKRVHSVASVDSGSLYYNYKETFSIILLALVDANSLVSILETRKPV